MTSVLDTITAYLTGKGFTRAQVAGIEGNLKIESGFSPTAENKREGAIGIAQWEKGRRTALQSYAKAHGGSETDLYTQLDFMWSELQGPENAALQAVLGAKTPEAAATAWDQKYERSSGGSRQARIDAAKALYGGAGSAGAVDSGSSSSSSDGTSVVDILGSIFIPGYGLIDNSGVPEAATSKWAGEALAVGTKILLTGAAIALVLVGAVKSVKDEG